MRSLRHIRRVTSRRLQLESLEEKRVLDSTVVINEVMYHPLNDDSGLEWLELHNQMATNMDISDWSLQSGIEYTFPDGTVIPAGGYLVVAADPSALQQATGFSTALGPYGGQLSNNGEVVRLVNNSQRVMDELEYSDDGQWPVGADGGGVTLAKLNRLSATAPAENWSVSEQLGGTPGAANFSSGQLQRNTYEFLSSGDNAQFLVPSSGNLGTDWTNRNYVEGSRGESWTTLPTGIGFLAAGETTSYSDVVLDDNPLAYWRFGETTPGGTATNLGILGATANGTYTAQADLGNDSLLQEPGDFSLHVAPTDTAAPMTTGTFEKVAAVNGVGGTGRTIELWTSLNSLPTALGNLVGDGESSIDAGMVVYLTTEGRIRLIVRTTAFAGLGFSSIDSQRILNVGEVVHVVGTWDRATGSLALYLDGQLAPIVNPSGPIPNASPARNTDNRIFIGRDLRGGTGADAQIDEVALYNYALASDRVAAHFAAGGPTFDALFVSDVQSSMHNVNSSAYLRLPFEYDGQTNFDQLGLSMRYDDGFVAYLNGVEVARRNAPAGTPAFNAAATTDRPFGDVSAVENIDLLPHAGLLVTGQNILSIHAMNVSASNDDFLIAPTLQGAGTEIPPLGLPPITINEIASSQDAVFRVELANDASAPIDLTGFVLVREGVTRQQFVLPSTQVPAGGLITFDQNTLGFDANSGDRIFLYTPGQAELIDARAVTNRLRGRAAERNGEWLYPSAPTFGTPNTFDFNDDIVINEIMYHAQPQYGTTPVTSKTNLVSVNSSWNHTAPAGGLAGGNLDWTSLDYNDTSWSSGQATFGASNNVFDYQGTILADTPLGYWRMGEASGPTVSDTSGNGRHGTADAGVTFGRQSLINGNTNTSLRTVGTSRVRVPGFEKFPAGATGFTVEYWIKLNAAPTAFHNIVGDGEGGGDFYFMNYLTASGQIRPHFSTANSPVSMDSVAQLSPGRAYHVVTTWDRIAGLGAIYIDGVLDSSVPVTGNVPANSGNSLYFGKDDREPGGDFDLDEIAIYARPLSASEVAEHFTAGAGAAFTTPLDLGPTTYYFRNEFDFAGDPAQATLELQTQIDDGAIFYLNGTEIYRQNMPAGPVTHTTLAMNSIGVAALGEPIEIPAAALIQGQNVLAVEVHQAVAADSDVTFAASLAVTQSIGQEQAFAENDEEWIELYNRGATPVDLSGWSFSDGIQFDFPAGLVIEPNSYIVIANDAAALKQKHANVADRIIGDFDGTLSNSGESLVLSDQRRNPVDEVNYYDSGRWAISADGGGSSLELRNPRSDNRAAEAWAASDESADSQWHTYTYRGIAANPPGANNPATYNEFSFGLLDAGELLIDDIHVIEDPSGTAREFIQNSGFNGTLDRWRPVGNQHGSVVVDPDDPSNTVFHLVATGPEEHLQNHVETTLKNGANFVSVALGKEYEISFRAKWLSGSPQLNTRLFFNLLPRTTIIEHPQSGGTPGQQNSTFETNIGPTYAEMSHQPVTPQPGEDVSVLVTATDPDQVSSMTLLYSVNGGAFSSVPMADRGDGEFVGVVPGQPSNAVVQFYVQGTDGSGAVSQFPAAGANSRALFKVGQETSTTGLQNIQVIMTPADATLLGQSTNLMSNDRLGATVIYEGHVVYDAGVRLKGSEHGRPDPNRRGLSVEFPPYDLFRGVHGTIGIDRSGGWRFGRTFGQDETLVYQFFNRAGGHPSMFNDLIFVDAPTLTNSTAILQMARYNDVFLDSQYDNGSDGTHYEYELIYTMLPSAGVESVKAAQEGPSVFGIPVGRNMGDDKEAYRHYFLIKNNTDKDDYEPMIRLAQTFALTGDAFFNVVEDVIDVDEWLRVFAALSLSGATDNYSNGAQHNAQFYERPSDGKMLLFPFDMDFAFNVSPTTALSTNGDLSKLLQSPHYSHFFLGHLQDIIATSFNTQYMGQWVSYVSSLLPGQDLSSITTWIGQRASFVQSQLPTLANFELFGEPPTTTSTTLVTQNANVNVLIPTAANGGDQLGTTWTSPGFTPSNAWLNGVSGVGYETSPADFAGLIGLDVGPAMTNVNESAFIRVPFDFNGDPDSFDKLLLRMRYDDGFVAYLNGVKVAEANAPGLPTWNSGATASHDDNVAVVFEDFDITEHLDLLNTGQNVLAIHGLNRLLTSSDFLIQPELVAQTIDEGQGGTDVIHVDTASATVGGTGWVNVREIFIEGATEPLEVRWTSSTAWEATIPVNFGTQDVTFVAYDFRGNQIATDTVTIISTANNPINGLRLSEINYNPLDATAAEGAFDNNAFEFLEFFNASEVAIELGGLRITDGIEFSFPSQQLQPGQYAVVVNDTTAFTARYGEGATILGEFGSGQLNNAGERIRVVDGGGTELLSVEYADQGLWSQLADGGGATLTLIDAANSQLQSQGKHYQWRASTEVGGSPGSAGLAPIGIVINEVRSNTDDASGELDAIELFNTTAAPINIGGWYLSDSRNSLLKYAIPADTILPAGGYLVFDENDFNPTPPTPAPNHFALNGSNGDSVFLVVSDGTRVTQLVDEVEFGGAPVGTTLGRSPNGTGRFVTMARDTLSCENSSPAVSDVIVSEVNYHPGAPSAAALQADPTITASDLEFIEIYNGSLTPVDLTDWRIRGEVDFDFAPATSIAAGATAVIVSFDPSDLASTARLAAFRAHYGMSASVIVLGDYNGQLSDSEGVVRLEQPDVPPADDPLSIPHVAVDQFVYDNLAPWATDAAGHGDSLQRLAPTSFANDPANWAGQLPSPGTVDFAATISGDLNGDQLVSAVDIDMLLDAVRRGNTSRHFDLNNSGTVDSSDVTFLLQDVLGTRIGDANLDGSVDASDFNIWNQNRFGHCSSWATGDFNGDGSADVSDFNLWLVNRFRPAPAAPAALRTVPRQAIAAGAVAAHDNVLRRWGIRGAYRDNAAQLHDKYFAEL